MSRPGWLKLWRKLDEHWLWEQRPYSQGQAWIDLLMRVNFSDSKIPNPGSSGSIMLGSGECIISLRNLERNWGWSRNRVLRFFDRLKTDTMVETTNETTFTRVKVLNWKKYQPSDDSAEPPTEPPDGTTNGTTNGTTSPEKGVQTEPLTEPIRRIQEESRREVKKKKDITTTSSPEVRELTETLIALWNTGKAAKEWIRVTPKRIAKTASRLKDGFTADQIKTAVGNCLKSEWHQGGNDRGWKAPGPEWVLESIEKLEQWIVKENGNGRGKPKTAGVQRVGQFSLEPGELDRKMQSNGSGEASATTGG